MIFDNLVEFFRLFNDSKHIDRITIVRGSNSYHKVEMYDLRDNLVAEATLTFIKGLPSLKITKHDHPLGAHLGLRHTFMPSQLDEPLIADYWERRARKPKDRKAGARLGKLSRMNSKVKKEQIKSAKALLATLSQQGNLGGSK